MKKGSIFTIFCICAIAMAFLFTGGCATSGQLKALQAQVDMNTQTANDAMTAAKDAKTTAENCCADSKQALESAEQAADRAESAAVKAENAANKSEVIFKKGLRK